MTPPLPVTDLLKRLSGTAAVSAAGMPLVLHHGTYTRFERFDSSRSKDIGIHFGTYDQANRRLRDLKVGDAKTDKDTFAPRGRVVAVALAIRNPVLLPGDPSSWNPSTVATMLRKVIGDDVCERVVEAAKRGFGGEAGAAQKTAIARYIAETGKPPGPRASDRIWDDILNQTRTSILAIVRDRLIALGHDGIVYPNQHETHGSRSLDRAQHSWVAFHAEQILPLGENLEAASVLSDVTPIAGRELAGSGFVPGANPALAPRDPMLRGGNTTTREQAKALVAAVEDRAARLGCSRVPPAHAWEKHRWEWLADLGEARLRLSADPKYGTAHLVVEGAIDADTFDALSAALAPLPRAPECRDDFVGSWRLAWEQGERLDEFLERVAPLFEAAETRLAAPTPQP